MTDSTNPLPSLLQMMVGGIARHVLTGIAGGLAVSAGLSGSQQAQLIQGGAAVIVWLAGALWSMEQKKQTVAAQAVPDFTP